MTASDKAIRAQNTLQLDRRYVLHPYSSNSPDNPLFAVDSASGCTITLQDGRRLIDGMSSWWSAIHGYNVPELNQAVEDQLKSMAHIMFGGFTHDPAVKLCKTLSEITPTGLDKVFLSDSGSVAVEVAIKMALQFFIAQNKPEKNRLISLRGGYHGDTFAAMAVCDPITGMHHLFSKVLKQQIFAEKPHRKFDQKCNSDDLLEIKALFEQHHHETAAFIIEPIVQGAGGMYFYSADYLTAIRELCSQYNVLLICDEIATGFGRTGKLFASEWADISPDILCLGKSLTGGYMTLAATLCSKQLAETICSGEAGAFMHGPTFMGNPLACSVANASIDLLLKSSWQEKIQHIESQCVQLLKPAQSWESVKEVRCLGAIAVIEMKHEVDMKSLQPALVEAGIWVRPFGRLIYLMPPFIITDQELTTLCNQLLSVIKNL